MGLEKAQPLATLLASALVSIMSVSLLVILIIVGSENWLSNQVCYILKKKGERTIDN